MAKKNPVSCFVPVEEYPYPVPENWRWVYALSVFNIVYGRGLSTKQLTDTGYPVFGANGQIGFYHEYMYEAEKALMSCRGAYSGTMNLTLPFSFVTNNSLIIEGKTDNISPMFIYDLFSALDVRPLITGSAQPQVTVNNFSKFAIPLPPLPEQRRIVERIESLFTKLDEARDKAQAVLDGYEYRRAAILHKAFTGELTESWRKENNITAPWTASQFGNLIDDAKLGLVRGRKAQFPDEKYFYLKMNNITVDGFMDLSSMVYVDATQDEAALFALDYGDFLFNTRNSYELVGKNTVWTMRTGVTTLFNNNIMRVRFKKGVNPFFVSDYLHSAEGKSALDRLKKNTTNVAAIYAKDLNKVTVPLPSVQEQERIVDILNHILQAEQQTKESAEAVLTRVGLMKKAILGRAFRGLLGTNHPEEPCAAT